MTVHQVEGMTVRDELVTTHLLDDELARLSEGFCPFRECHEEAADLRLQDDRLTITADGWGLCTMGNRYRIPLREI